MRLCNRGGRLQPRGMRGITAFIGDVNTQEQTSSGRVSVKQTSPSHLVGPHAAFPRSDKRRVGQERHRVEGSRAEVRSHRADDDEDHRTSGSRHAQRRLDREESGEAERPPTGRLSR